MGLGFSLQLSWPASSAILARRRRSQRAVQNFEIFPRLHSCHSCKWRSPWSLDTGAPSGVACVGHERCLNTESGARRRRAAAPEAADGICGSSPSIAHVLSRVARLVLQALVAAAGRFLTDHLRRGAHAGCIARVPDIFLCPVHRRLTLASNERKKHLCLRHLAPDTLLWAMRKIMCALSLTWTYTESRYQIRTRWTIVNHWHTERV